MPKYKIPVVWQSWGLIEVEAKDVEEAKEKALENGLPDNPEYIDDSFEIDEEGIDFHNPPFRKNH